MIQLTKEDHAAAAALASRMKAEFATVPPQISIAAVHMLQLEIAVHLSAGNKKAALDYLKAMAHDARDSIRAHFRAVEERKRAEEAAKANGGRVVIDEVAAISPETWNKLAKDDA